MSGRWKIVIEIIFHGHLHIIMGLGRAELATPGATIGLATDCAMAMCYIEDSPICIPTTGSSDRPSIVK